MATATLTNEQMQDTWNSMMNSEGGAWVRTIGEQVTGVFGATSSFVGDNAGHVLEAVSSPIIETTQNLFDAAKIKAIGATPNAMLENFSNNPNLQNEDGQKLIQIMKDDPAFTEAFHSAMINEPTMAPGIVGLMTAEGPTSGTPSLTDVVDGLSDDGNRSKFTQVLNAVAQNPDLNFDYTMDVAEAAQKVSQPGVQQDDYKKLQSLLLRSNVKDPMLDFAADPQAAFGDFMKDPSAFFDQLANSLVNFDGPLAEMLRGVIQGMGQYIELIASPEIMEFYGHYIDPVVNDVIDKLDMNEEGITAEVASAPVANSVLGNDLGTSFGYDEVKALLFVNGNTDTRGSLGSEINVGSDSKSTLSLGEFRLKAANTPDQDDQPEQTTPAPFIQQQQNFDSLRMGGLG